MVGASLPSVRVPNSDRSVERASCYSVPVKGDGVNLAKVARQRSQAGSLRNAPDPCGGVVTTTDDKVAVNL